MAETARWTRWPQARPIPTAVGAILAVELVGASGSIFTAMGLESWYPALAKPPITPPSWVFAPVWTTLFALLGLAVWLVWRRTGDPADGRFARLALALFAVHMVVNVAWSAAFFGLQSVLAGLVVIAVLWGLIVATLGAFARVDRRAGALLGPYLAWTTFAAVLNGWLWVLN